MLGRHRPHDPLGPLAPDIAAAVLDGREPDALAVHSLGSDPLPPWDEQREQSSLAWCRS
jgi:hypothetical protein